MSLIWLKHILKARPAEVVFCRALPSSALCFSKNGSSFLASCSKFCYCQCYFFVVAVVVLSHVVSFLPALLIPVRISLITGCVHYHLTYFCPPPPTLQSHSILYIASYKKLTAIRFPSSTSS